MLTATSLTSSACSLTMRTVRMLDGIRLVPADCVVVEQADPQQTGRHLCASMEVGSPRGARYKGYLLLGVVKCLTQEGARNPAWLSGKWLLLS
jgi:hypothetical protein